MQTLYAKDTGEALRVHPIDAKALLAGGLYLEAPLPAARVEEPAPMEMVPSEPAPVLVEPKRRCGRKKAVA